MSEKYASNSIKSREQRTTTRIEDKGKTVTKVVRGGVKVRKKSEVKKIANSIISEECKSIKEYAIYEVLVPVVKETISQLVKGSIDMLFWGEVRNTTSRSRSGTNASRVSYRDYYDDRRDRDRDSRRRDPVYSYDDITFEYKEDAEEVLNRMDEIVEQYGAVSVSDLFELAGRTGNGYTDNNYGWTSLRSASVERLGPNEYIIRLTRPKHIK